MKRPSLSVSPMFFPAVCLFLYLDIYGFALPFFAAALLHELAHLSIMLLCRVSVSSLRVQPFGTAIAATFTCTWKEAVVTAAGPLANLILALCFRSVFPVFCFMNLLLLSYNLLPIYPLDGGRLCKLFVRVLWGEHAADTAADVISFLTIGILVSFCVYAAAVRHFGLLPLVFAASLLMRLPNASCQTPKKLIQYWKDRTARYHDGSANRKNSAKRAKTCPLRGRRI